MIPVEPDQDNACAGMVDFLSISPRIFQLLPPSVQSWNMKSIYSLIIFFIALNPLLAQVKTPSDSLDKPALKDSFRIKNAGLFLETVEIKAIRAGDKAPFTKTDLDAVQIARVNDGRDIPYILDQTPSVVSSSDAGNGIGYTGISIRGTDASRINMTLNGIPFNDAESQALYFVDLPDFVSSTNSIQIQRGVGTSSNGAGAFGASMNFSTNEFHPDTYAEFNNSYGSFNSWKNTLKAGTGLIGGHYTVDLRLSHISSNGYIDRATSELKSLYFSTAYVDEKMSIRFNLISGSEKTYQAWNGVPAAKVYGDSAALQQEYLNNSGYPGALYSTQADSVNLFTASPRRYNYFLYPNQTDNYRQDHYQIFFNRQISTFLQGNLAAFLTRGKGYYEEYETQAPYSNYGLPDPSPGDTVISSTDLVRQRWLDNYFYGGIYSLQYKKENTSLVLGGGWTEYDGKHFGNVTWAQEGGVPAGYEYYNVPAKKTDFNIYLKWQQQLGQWFSTFADLQWRNVNYWIDGFDNNPTLHVYNHYNFINPKAGLSYNRGPWQVYLSFARATHEPNRDDFETGLNEQPLPETVNDFELGISKKTPLAGWGVTGYYMLYHDQLVLTGKINDVGEYTRTNTPRSYKLGIELQGNIKPLSWLQASGNLTISENKISGYTEYVDDYDSGGQKSQTFSNTKMALSPDIIAAATLSFSPIAGLELSLPAKFVGNSYLDNTENNSRMISGYYVQNLRVIYTPAIRSKSAVQFILYLNNVFNKKYEANGYTYSYISGGSLVTENFLFPQAGTNLMFSVNITLR